MTKSARPERELRVFISYSRDDLDFADQLAAGLRVGGFEPSIDRHGISGGEDWKLRLGALIRDAETVLFVLSASSAQSPICQWEVAEAVRLGKRIIPVLPRPLEGAIPPPELADRNYIFFYAEPKSPGSGFGTGLVQLVSALNTDLEWLREHTRYLQRALEWDAGGRQDIRLLSGSDIVAAKAWAAGRPQGQPEPTALQRDFIRASEDAEADRENATRRALEERARLLTETETAQARTARLQQRARWALAVIAALVVIGVGVVSWQYKANLTLETSLQQQQANLLGQLASIELMRGNIDSALRFSAQGAQIGLALAVGTGVASPAAAQLATVVSHTDWHLTFHTKESLISAAFSPDGMRIVTASSDNTARIWDAANGKEIKVLRGHDGAVLSAAFSPDGTRIVTASKDKTARIWNVATGNVIKVLRGHEGDVISAAFSQDGTRIVTASSMSLEAQTQDLGLSPFTARIWNAPTGEELKVLRWNTGPLYFAAFSPDGTRIVTASAVEARISDATTGNDIKVLSGHESNVLSAAFSPDGTRIVTASWDNTARIWDATTGNEVKVLRGHEGAVLSAAFSPDGTRIVTASVDNTARIWDAAAGNEIKLLRGHEGAVLSAAFSPDGMRIVTASGDNTVRIWDAVAGKEITVLRGHEDYVHSTAFSPDGTRIVTASGDNTARIWDAATGKEIKVLRGHESILSSAAFSPDGTRIVTASGDGTARIWDAASGNEIKILRGHQYPVRSAAFSPDGTRILTGS
ncbi:MAG: TIR domain-containing protein, partial [Bradyrhizobiaceae bacterium]|nr:TIR domain-containing protein [Bradyrhizobiaceae bacterium]